jgi:hypothetical protein
VSFDATSALGTHNEKDEDMNVLQGTVMNGQIVLDNPVELREGTRVDVLPIEARQPAVGMREEEWPTTPEGIATLLARMDTLEPGWLLPEDDAAWRLALREQGNIEKVRFSEDAGKLRRMWE